MVRNSIQQNHTIPNRTTPDYRSHMLSATVVHMKKSFYDAITLFTMGSNRAVGNTECTVAKVAIINWNKNSQRLKINVPNSRVTHINN